MLNIITKARERREASQTKRFKVESQHAQSPRILVDAQRSVRKSGGRVRLADDGGGQEGFTLIELVVVVAIIGILTAIAIPVTGAIQRHSKQTAFEASANNLMKAFDARFTLEGGTYATVGARGEGGAFFGKNMNLAERIKQELIAENGPAQYEDGSPIPLSETEHGYWLGIAISTNRDSDGSQTMNPCFYIHNEDLGRTICRDGAVKNGPNFG